MKALSTILLLSLTTACAARTTPTTTAATPPQKVVAAASKPAPPPCLDAMRHAPIFAETTAEDGTPYIAPIDLKLDLDGDGTPDPVVEVDRDATSVRYELYLTRGKCARHLGTARVEGTIRGTLGKSYGLSTLEVASEGDGELRHGELSFDGKKWSITKRWTSPLK